jgi:hypothetical protein
MLWNLSAVVVENQSDRVAVNSRSERLVAVVSGAVSVSNPFGQ